MGSRHVSLKEDAYARLKAARLPGETYSDTLDRLLTRKTPSFLGLAGFLTAQDAEEIHLAIREMRRLEARGTKTRL